MFTDKQSLILCAIVILGFIITGITGLLDNYAILFALLTLFLIIIFNVVREVILNHSKKRKDKNNL
ncbi:hypothetical protein GCM10022271_19380 [Corallibacter vietnamensis]|uniref:Phosphatidate cytidylyltransferase n=1 Tax=Corallibacter vietnamensis TaxID=904130 RepID=A0ABP7HEK7_9FLAO